jgi:hypothetical protein
MKINFNLLYLGVLISSDLFPSRFEAKIVCLMYEVVLVNLLQMDINPKTLGV